MKKFLLLFLTFIALNVTGQDNDYFKIKEGSFKHISMAVWDDNKEDHRDIDNNPMALFKISTENINDEQRRKLYFTGNRVTEISDKVYKTGAVWIYITAQNSDYLEIRHPDYGITRFYFPESLCDFCTYEMVLQYVPLSEAIVQSNYLIIKSDQADARIFIDDTLVGKQFIHKQFNVGSSHTWRVECDLYHTETGEVEITAEENYIDLKMKPEYGFINITSVPNFAKVYVDDNYVGDTPYSSEKMNIGNYTIRVEKDEYQSIEKNVVVNDKLTTKESFYLQSNYVDITINADKDSDIYVDNIYKGRGRWEGKLLYGIHDVEARKANHRTVNRNVELVIGETKSITLDAPVPIYGMLEISSNPTEASVYIDGKYCGQTPMQLAQIIIGNHELKLEKQGCASLTKTFAIKEGETLDINESLQTGKAITISTEETGDKIYVDEKYIGVTPLTVNLTYDTHLIKVERGNMIVSKTITVSQYGGDDNVKLSFGEVNGHEYVDLGLSVKWATCNVGANKPEEFGDSFAWGETTPKSKYTYDNSLTYDIKISRLQKRGIIDSNGNLTSSYDVATANWGGTWRMPTKSELEELEDKCTWTWTKQNNVIGYKVTGPNGNSIFLPAAGYRYGFSLSRPGKGEDGCYWSSAPIESDSKYAYRLDFSSGSQRVGWSDRYGGLSVRPVSE